MLISNNNMGFRLGIYLLIRNVNKTEDIRYVKIREARDIGLYLTLLNPNNFNSNYIIAPDQHFRY